MYRYSILLLFVFAVVGCKASSGPPSTSQTSATTRGLAERIKIVETYVNFRRQYEALEYSIDYENNGGGMVPGPSDWDIRLVAQIPGPELEDWIGANMKPDVTPHKPWHQFGTEIDVSGVDEWFRNGGRVVGIDRENRIVVYRANSFGD